MSQAQTLAAGETLKMQTPCPCCGQEVVGEFYSVQAIPVHSCLLLASGPEAREFPRRDLRLGFCRRCGFIFNSIFDPGVHRYSTACEEAQTYSPRFNHFQDRLIARLVDDYGVRHKQVVEIGCGKGDFLVRLCERGENAGLGIDPGYIPQRTSTRARVRFSQDVYGEKFADLSADFVCCRHTLEHIGPTRRFLQTLRRGLEGQKNCLVFFEVPDVRRVLREGAFWDVYYEHCSYFSPGSLARLFRSCGFDILELQLDFADQYVLLLARPGDSPAPPHLPIANDLCDMAAEVANFTLASRRGIGAWRASLRASASAGRKVAIWGSGSKAVAFLTTLGIGGTDLCVTDINPHRHGRYLPGIGSQIMPPAYLAQYRPDEVIVMNPVYADEIRLDLRKMGLQPRVLSV